MEELDQTAEIQPGLHHGGLRRRRIEEQIRQLAGMRGLMEAVGRDHRDADHRELP